MYIIIFVAVIDGNNDRLGLVVGCNEANEWPSPQWHHPLGVTKVVRGRNRTFTLTFIQVSILMSTHIPM